MKRKTNYKNLISLALVLILLIAIAVPSSFALDSNKRRFGAMVLSAIQALNITVQSTLAPAQSIIDAIADPPGLVGVYEYPWEPEWDNEILNRSSIQIWPEYTEIDGVKYTDVWLSHDAAEKFRVNAFDWKTAYNIASESHGTFASGVGHIDGNPVFEINGSKVTQYITVPYDETPNETIYYAYGNGAIGSDWKYGLSGRPIALKYRNSLGNETGSINAGSSNQTSAANILRDTRYNQNWLQVFANGSLRGQTQLPANTPYNDIPFDFDYVSGVIPADQVLPEDTGMMIRVPSNTQGLQTFIENNIDFTNEGGVNLDFDVHPELEIAVDDLLDIIAPIIPIINGGDINFIENHDAPEPDPRPDPAPDVDPETPVTDITYNDYYETITNQTEYINNTVENIDNSIQNVDNHIENIYNQNENIVNNVENVNENVENINDNIENIYNQQQDIIDNQDTIIENQDTIIQETIPEIIENIPKIDDICNNIDTAPYHDLDTGLDRLPSFFLPFITDLRSALGIWHYVTEWLAQISTTFAFISGCLVGTSIMTPIYAAIAGFMCIKIYRRMTA